VTIESDHCIDFELIVQVITWNRASDIDYALLIVQGYRTLFMVIMKNPSSWPLLKGSEQIERKPLIKASQRKLISFAPITQTSFFDAVYKLVTCYPHLLHL
jgi:hypothetical protein